eukprot:3991927-Pleurochrysis_carterae.AAC.3
MRRYLDWGCCRNSRCGHGREVALAFQKARGMRGKDLYPTKSNRKASEGKSAPQQFLKKESRLERRGNCPFVVSQPRECCQSTDLRASELRFGGRWLILSFEYVVSSRLW